MSTSTTIERVLDATACHTIDGGLTWPLNVVAAAVGASADEVGDALPDWIGELERDAVHVVDDAGDRHHYGEIRLSALAAYTAAMTLGGGNGESDIAAYFGGRLAGARIAAREPGPGAVKNDPVPDRLILSEYLMAKTGDAVFSERYKSTFGKRVKAAYVEEYGQEPPTETVDIDGREAQVCVYTEADRPLVDRVWLAGRGAEWVGRR